MSRWCLADGVEQLRISIFLNVFNVHVNRSPIGGVIRNVRYQKGKFLNAMAANSADENEQNIVTVEGEGQTVVFKQIAGLIARRIVFNKKVGDTVARGERVGLIKFGSRVDVLMRPEVKLAVKVGDHVKGASSILAYAPVAQDASALEDAANRCGGATKWTACPSPRSRRFRSGGRVIVRCGGSARACTFCRRCSRREILPPGSTRFCK